MFNVQRFHHVLQEFNLKFHDDGIYPDLTIILCLEYAFNFFKVSRNLLILGQIKNYVCLRFPNQPCIKGSTPNILGPKFYFRRQIWRSQNFFRDENRTILKEVMAIFAKQILNMECRNILSNGQSL